MTYELAKKLQKAGYSQGPKQRMIDEIKTGPESYSKALLNDLRIKDVEEIVYYPTLSELIEACGDRFAALRKPLHPVPGKWIANADISMRHDHETYDFGEWGDTPEESVANLFLALHK